MVLFNTSTRKRLHLKVIQESIATGKQLTYLPIPENNPDNSAVQLGLFDISRAANINRASSYINRLDSTIVDRKSAMIANIIKTIDKPDWKSSFDFVTKQQWNLIDKTSWEKELIEPSDYRSIKADYINKITCLESKLIEL